MVSKRELALLRGKFKKGDRVRLLEMIDEQAPKVGTTGTVVGVDDLGSILIKWDNGSSLNVLYRIDKCEVIYD